MTPEVQAVLATGVVVPVAAVLILWLKRKLKLSDEAAEAVSGGNTIKPKDTDQALITLAHKVNEQGNSLADVRAYIPQLAGWGHRGWAHAEPAQREPMPAPPPSLTI